jgi:hypothetical protein
LENPDDSEDACFDLEISDALEYKVAAGGQKMKLYGQM